MTIKEFGAKLRRARIEAGLTLDEVAAKVRVATSTVHMWENGQCWPGRRLLPRVARALKLDSKKLISDYTDAKMAQWSGKQEAAA